MSEAGSRRVRRSVSVKRRLGVNSNIRFKFKVSVRVRI